MRFYGQVCDNSGRRKRDKYEDRFAKAGFAVGGGNGAYAYRAGVLRFFENSIGVSAIANLVLA